MIIKKIFTKKEAKELWENNQVRYAEIAHSYPCCDLPTDTQCVWCDEAIAKEWECPKLKKQGYYE